MSISHKACLFDCDAFDRELAATLADALDTRSSSALIEFCETRDLRLDLDRLREEREEYAEATTEERAALAEVQSIAHVALRPYRDPEDLGLGHCFDALFAYCASTPKLSREADELIAGRPFGPVGRRLDPGFMGTGITTPGRVQSLLALLTDHHPEPPSPASSIYARCHYKPASAEEVIESYVGLTTLYQRAAKLGRGIFFCDFNDRGMIGQ